MWNLHFQLFLYILSKTPYLLQYFSLTIMKSILLFNNMRFAFRLLTYFPLLGETINPNGDVEDCEKDGTGSPKLPCRFLEDTVSTTDKYASLMYRHFLDQVSWISVNQKKEHEKTFPLIRQWAI